MMTTDLPSIRSVAEKVLVWAREHGALADDFLTPPIALTDAKIFPNFVEQRDRDDTAKAEKALERIKVVAVAVDENRRQAVILTKSQISGTTAKLLPDTIDGVTIKYVGQAGIIPNPPALPQSSIDAAQRCYLHNGHLACGSSVIAASIWNAGTFGALVKLGDDALYGLTNNHVTGGCNHTRVGMHILCPAPIDADPDHAPPVAIGRHHSFVPLTSGDPRQVVLQEFDVALFRITRPELVTSMQGVGLYDTPTMVADPIGGMKVKKVGRTTGKTSGMVMGEFLTPLGIPYESERFRSTVYFNHAWMISTGTEDAFSLGGDSGSLIVTEDGSKAVGLIFAGATNGSVSYMLPIRGALDFLGASLVSGHNV